jgi:hypothetical protein
MPPATPRKRTILAAAATLAARQPARRKASNSRTENCAGEIVGAVVRRALVGKKGCPGRCAPGQPRHGPTPGWLDGKPMQALLQPEGGPAVPFKANCLGLSGSAALGIIPARRGGVGQRLDRAAGRPCGVGGGFSVGVASA